MCIRDSNTHRRFTTILALDTEDENSCTGAAGATWWRAAKKSFAPRFLFVDLDPKTCTVSEYAKECMLSYKEAEKLTYKSTRFLSGPVIVDGKIWGVLVFDTDDPGWAVSSQKKSRLRKDFNRALLAISWVLQK